MEDVYDDVRSLSEPMRDVRRNNALFLQNPINPVHGDNLEEALRQVEEAVEGAEPETRFGELLTDEVKHQIRVNRDIHRFITRHEENDLTVPEAVDLVYGEGTFDRIESGIHDFDWEKQATVDELQFDRSHAQITPFSETDLIEESMNDIDTMVRQYAEQEGLFPDGFDYSYEFIPPGVPQQKQRAHWKTGRGIAMFPYTQFEVLEENGDRTVDATRAVFTYFHEILAHGVHKQLSEQLPIVDFPESVYERLPAYGHAEGFAMRREQEAEAFIDEFDEELDGYVSEDAMRMRDIRTENQQWLKPYVRLLQEQETRGEIESAREKLMEVYPEGYANHLLSNTNMSLANALKEASYAGGLQQMDQIGYDDRSVEAVATGLWSPGVIERAVEYTEESLN